jgi:hypothetical protein
VSSEQKKILESRRNFLKIAASSAAGIMVMGAAGKRTYANLPTVSPWPATGYLQINPNIDNCRVVYVNDPTMLITTGTYNFKNFNDSGVNYAIVKANIDKMACALAQKTVVADAWKTIFRRPEAKAWADVKVAIKVNAVGGYSPNVPIVAKLCEVLFGLGVPYANITLFDAGNATGNGCVDKYGQYKTNGKLPAITVAARGLDTQLPIGTESLFIQNCVLESDILITCAVNKGHDQKDKFGGLTMSIKNHTGTIKYGCASSLTQLINYHKSEWILGTPSAVVPVRQQLAFVDATWAGAPGSWGGAVNNGAVQNTIVMGTFPGAVDYLTATKVRANLYPNIDTNNCNIGLINQYLTGFGYTDTERTTLETMDPNADLRGRGFVDAAAWYRGNVATQRPAVSAERNASSVSLEVPGSVVRVDLAQNDIVKSAAVFAASGKKIRALKVPKNSSGPVRLSWDGTDVSGRAVRAGAYVVRVVGRASSASAQVTISR